MPVGAEPRCHLLRPHGAAHVALQHLDLGAQARGIIAPADGEPAALQHQHLVAARQHVGQCGFPGAVAVGDVDVGATLGLEHKSDIAQQAVGQRQQRAGIDIHRRAMHRAQHFIRDIRRPRDCQKLP